MLEHVDRSDAAWWVGAALLVATILFVLHAFVGTFLLGLFLYYAARPVYVRLRGPLRSPGLAASVALFALALPVFLLFAYTLALAVGQLQTVLDGEFSQYVAMVEPLLGAAGTAEALPARLDAIAADPLSFLRGERARQVLLSLVGPVAGYLGAILNALVHGFLAVALAYYLLKDGDALSAWVRRHFGDTRLDEYGSAVDRDLQTIYFGNILTAFITGVLGAVVFYALSRIAPPAVPLPVPILLGLLTGLGSLVPVVGMKIVYVPVAVSLSALALLADPGTLWYPVLFFVVTLVVVDTVPDVVLRPYVSGRNLHVGAVMFSYIFGSLLFGWYGLFLGPLLLVVVMDFGLVVVPELT